MEGEHKYRFNWDGRFVQTVEILFDLFGVLLGFYIALSIENYEIIAILFKISEWEGFLSELYTIFSSYFIFVFVTIILFRVYKVSLSKKKYISSILSVALSLLLANFIILLYGIAVEGIVQHQHIGVSTYPIAFLFQFIFIAFFKLLIWCLMVRFNNKYVIIIGPKEEVLELAIKFFNDGKHYMKLKYCYFEKNDILNEDVFFYMDQCDFVYITKSTADMNKSSIIHYCISKKNLSAYLIPQLYEIAILNSRVEQIDDVLSFAIDSFQFSLEQRIIKRIFDIFVSLLAIVVLSPFMLLTIIALKIENSGPVFFRQIRITKGGKEFRITKFRSMCVDQGSNCNKRAEKDDERITRIGKVIRKTRIDEFPQLFHVLFGKMSMVGPRALCKEEILEFTSKNPNFKYRFNVKAGLTGAAQANATSGISFEERLNFDLLDIRNYSIQYDIKILFLTFRTMFDGKMSTGVAKDNNSIEQIKRINLHYKKDSDIISF